MKPKVTIKVLGVRGTSSVHRPDARKYGGATGCLLLRIGGEVIVLDGGTGFMELEQELGPEERTLHLLLSHPHFDHIAGLPNSSVFFNPENFVKIYAVEHGGLSAKQQVEQLMAPPLWPVGPEAFLAQTDFHTMEGDFSLGAVRVRMLEGNHPGGCTVYRVEYGETSIVYATDYEMNEESYARLADFAKNCTLLLCDGHYFGKELESHRGFGHSSWQQAAELAEICGAERLLIVHHAPWRTDAELDEAGTQLREMRPNSAFARQGEELVL